MHPHSSIFTYRPLLLQCTPYLPFVSFSVTSLPWYARCLFTIVSPLFKPPILSSQMSPSPQTSLENVPSALLPVCTILSKIFMLKKLKQSFWWQGFGQGSSGAVLNILNNIISDKVYMCFLGGKGLGLPEYEFTKINKFHLLSVITAKLKKSKWYLESQRHCLFKL